MATKRILVIPHVGTAYGHLIRVGELLNTNYATIPEVYVCIPETAIAMAKLHMPSNVRFLPFNIRPTITSAKGKLDTERFVKLFEYDRGFYEQIRPDLIVGDPGIRAGLLGEETGTPWEALMHGCFLPLPSKLKNKPFVSGRVGILAELAWKTAQRSLDDLVRLGSRGTIPSWSELRKRGRILIPNSPEAEPCVIGVHLGNWFSRIGFKVGREFPCVLTLCSSGDVAAPANILEQLASLYGEVAVVGPTPKYQIKGVHYLESNFATETVVGKDTIVICHGGHGTLRAVKQACRVIIAPGDVDQLCNALTAHANLGMELAIGQKWFDRLNSRKPFQRLVDWNAVRVVLSGS